MSYASWKTKLKALLVRDELWDVVNEPRTQEVTNEWNKSNKKELDTALLCNHTWFGRFTIHGLCVQNVVIRIFRSLKNLNT